MVWGEGCTDLALFALLDADGGAAVREAVVADHGHVALLHDKEGKTSVRERVRERLCARARVCVCVRVRGGTVRDVNESA